MLVGTYQLKIRIANQLPEELERQSITTTFVVTGLPEYSEESTRFSAHALAVEDSAHNAVLAKKMRLTWRNAPSIEPGDQYNVVVSLRTPRGLVNPNTFDYQAWLLQKGVYATGYIKKVLPPSSEKIELNVRDRFLVFINKKREKIRRRLQQLEIDNFSILNALLVGDKSFITDTQWDTFNQTGTVHLIAISGLHVGLVATIGFFIGKLLVHIFSGLIPFLFIRLIPVISSLALASSYAMLAGFSIPTQRALIFVLLFNVSYLFSRKVSVFYVFLIALVIVVLIDPFAFYQRGFWLSFLAVLILFYCFSGRIKNTGFAKGLLKTQCVLFVGLCLPLLFLELPVSITSPVANMVAVPMVSLLIVPGLLVFFLLDIFSEFVANQLIYLLDFLVSLLSAFLAVFSKSTFELSLPVSTVNVLVGVLGLALVLSPSILKLRLLGATLCGILLITALFPKQSEKDDVFKLVALDVGQGLSLFMTANRQTLLYDTGARYSSGYDMGKLVITPYLKSLGLSTIEHLVVSHTDIDHIGGLNTILKSFDVSQLYIPEDVIDQYSSSHRTAVCDAGRQWSMGNADFEILWPESNLSQSNYNDNNRSCVILVRYQGYTILLTGDIEKEVELLLLQSGRIPDNVDVLIAAHHGSNSSSTTRFVEAVRPDHVIFSAGFKNRYKHPASKVVNRFKFVDSQIWNTAIHGAVSVEIGKNGALLVSGSRQTAPKPWFREHSAENQ